MHPDVVKAECVAVRDCVESTSEPNKTKPPLKFLPVAGVNEQKIKVQKHVMCGNKKYNHYKIKTTVSDLFCHLPRRMGRSLPF